MTDRQVKTMRLSIKGVVQGVGYRVWLAGRAEAAGLAGWVRNRNDGSVEAVLSGAPEAVDLIVDACWRGPAASRVTAVELEPAQAPAGPGFAVRPRA